ncbi:tail fiber domain-containing protein [Pseudomonas sp. Q1]|uniref:tail fiber domain-containing protein n=1 Tax=Pseudomonas sp. Q1 TaxID=2202823 RepID=UPI001374A9D8|nr:tail fiber domain-containing protein [Pseudomonas sp. Q1]NCE88445.1 tail fiber domain-containing protein [Pseudomonas sp. Q1]
MSNNIASTARFATGFAMLLVTTVCVAALENTPDESADPRNIGGICCPFSDRDLKQNVQPLQGSTDKILQLKGVSYEWLDSGKHDIGLIAQDVEKIYPDITRKQGDHLQVDYQKLVAPLIESIRELDARLDALEKAKKE